MGEQVGDDVTRVRGCSDGRREREPLDLSPGDVVACAEAADERGDREDDRDAEGQDAEPLDHAVGGHVLTEWVDRVVEVGRLLDRPGRERDRDARTRSFPGPEPGDGAPPLGRQVARREEQGQEDEGEPDRGHPEPRQRPAEPWLSRQVGRRHEHGDHRVGIDERLDREQEPDDEEQPADGVLGPTLRDDGADRAAGDGERDGGATERPGIGYLDAQGREDQHGRDRAQAERDDRKSRRDRLPGHHRAGSRSHRPRPFGRRDLARCRAGRPPRRRCRPRRGRRSANAAEVCSASKRARSNRRSTAPWTRSSDRLEGSRSHQRRERDRDRLAAGQRLEWALEHQDDGPVGAEEERRDHQVGDRPAHHPVDLEEVIPQDRDGDRRPGRSRVRCSRPRRPPRCSHRARRAARTRPSPTPGSPRRGRPTSICARSTRAPRRHRPTSESADAPTMAIIPTYAMSAIDVSGWSGTPSGFWYVG